MPRTQRQRTSMTLTDAELGAIEARAAAATPGPWKYGGMIGDPGELLRHFVEADGELICYSKPFAADYAGGDKTFEFIAHARADVPALIAALRESRERERQYRAALRSLGTETFYVCDGCGVPYAREKRLPKPGQRNFCDTCGGKAAVRLATRRWRARTRAALNEQEAT